MSGYLLRSGWWYDANRARCYITPCSRMDMARIAKTTENDREMGVWTAIGVGTGAAIGVATGTIAVWTAVGAAAGVAIGAARRRRSD